MKTSSLSPPLSSTGPLVPTHACHLCHQNTKFSVRVNVAIVTVVSSCILKYQRIQMIHKKIPAFPSHIKTIQYQPWLSTGSQSSGLSESIWVKFHISLTGLLWPSKGMISQVSGRSQSKAMVSKRVFFII